MRRPPQGRLAPRRLEGGDGAGRQDARYLRAARRAGAQAGSGARARHRLRRPLPSGTCAGCARRSARAPARGSRRPGAEAPRLRPLLRSRRDLRPPPPGDGAVGSRRQAPLDRRGEPATGSRGDGQSRVSHADRRRASCRGAEYRRRASGRGAGLVLCGSGALRVSRVESGYFPLMQSDFVLPSSRLSCLRRGAVVVGEDSAVFGVTGPGALGCLQGLLTSDLVAAGDGSVVFGAVLTPKGMIVSDLWVLRLGEKFTLLAPRCAHKTVGHLFEHSLPPRLARVTDLTGAWSAVWLLGAAAPERLARATGRAVPGPGRVLGSAPDDALLAAGEIGAAGVSVLLLRPAAQGGGVLGSAPDDALLAAGGPAAAAFSVLLLGPAAQVEGALARLDTAGGHRGDPADLAAARLLAGWPPLGRGGGAEKGTPSGGGVRGRW